MRADIKFASPQREAEATYSKQFASPIEPGAVRKRTEIESKTNHLANQHSTAAQKRIETEPKANQKRIKSRKTFLNACKSMSDKLKNLQISRTDRTSSFFHVPSLLIRQTT